MTDRRFELCQEALAVEALVGAQEDPRVAGQAPQALREEPPGAGGGGGVSVPQRRVQPLACLREEADERVPGDLARVGAARSLTRADRAVVLDEGGVEVERHPVARKERLDAREQLVERAVELPQVAEREARKEAAERGRVGDGVASQQLLGRVGAQQAGVVEAVAATDQRFTESEGRLGGRVATLSLLDRDRVEKLWQAEPSDELAHEHEAALGRQPLRRALDPDRRRSPCYRHLQECPPSARRDVSSTPMVSAREDVSLPATSPLSQDPGS